MRWECARLPAMESRAYYGHVLERAMEIIDGESRTPWVGWRCVRCGDRFSLPGEPDRYDMPLMERVEVEDETDVLKHVIETCMTRLGRLNALTRSMMVDARVAHIDSTCRELTFSRLSKGMV
jgi:hypothetical protein